MYIVVVVETKLEAPRLEMSALEKYFIHDCLLDFSRYLWFWINNKFFIVLSINCMEITLLLELCMKITSTNNEIFDTRSFFYKT